MVADTLAAVGGVEEAGSDRTQARIHTLLDNHAVVACHREVAAARYC